MATRAQATNFIRHQLRVRELFIKDERLSSLHVSLYFALFFEWNECRFQNPFFINRSEIMNASKIGNANTYTKCLKELDLFGYIEYKPSYNPNKGSTVNLYTFDNGTDKGSGNGSDKGTDKGGVQVVIPFNKHIKHNKENKHKKGCKGELPFASSRDDLKIVQPQKSNTIKFSPPTLEEKAIKLSKTEARTGSSNSRGTAIDLPNLEQVKEFFNEKNKSDLEAEKFFNHFESNGWLVGGKTKMKNWQAAARNWILNSEKFNGHILTKVSSGADRLLVETNKNYDIPL